MGEFPQGFLYRRPDALAEALVTEHSPRRGGRSSIQPVETLRYSITFRALKRPRR